jgi:hypothetical protein
MTFAIPSAVDVTHSYSKHLVCVDAGNTDDQSTCVAWGCWASFSVPLRVEVKVTGMGFTMPPVSSWAALRYGIPQKDCQNPSLELGEAQTQMQRSVANLALSGLQAGAGTTTGLVDVYVSATLTTGSPPGSAELTNFSYDQGTPQISIARPLIFLSEYRRTLKRLK